MCLIIKQRNSLAVQWLGLCSSTAGDLGSIPGWGTKILQAAWSKKKKILLIIKQNLEEKLIDFTESLLCT